MQENYRVKAHLIVKPKKSPGKRDYVMIRLRGETCVVTPCSYANHTGEDRSEVWDNGTVLFSDVLGEPQTDPAATPACILAAGTGSNLYSLNQAVIRIEDLPSGEGRGRKIPLSVGYQHGLRGYRVHR